MLIEHLLINPHLAPFIILFFLAFPFVILAPLHYQIRKRKILVVPKDLLKYNKFERTLFILGIMMGVLGILGTVIVTEKYGYNVIVTELDNTKTIENIRP